MENSKTTSQFELSKGLFSFAKALWAHGKHLPVVGNLFGTIESSFSVIVQKTAKKDLLALENDNILPQLKNFDDMLETVVCKVIGVVMRKEEGQTATRLQIDEQLVKGALAFKLAPAKEVNPYSDLSISSRESPGSKSVPYKKTETVKHPGRFLLFSPKRSKKSRRKAKKKAAKIHIDSSKVVLSPAKSELGETLLIKEAIQFISSEDFTDVSQPNSSERD